MTLGGCTLEQSGEQHFTIRRNNSTMTTGAADKTAGRVLLPSNIVPIR